MRLQSHDVKIVDIQNMKEFGSSDVVLTDSNGNTQTLRIANDFAVATTEPGVISVSTLIDILHKAMSGGFPVPATQAAAWRAIVSAIRNAKDAHNFSQAQQSIEDAEPGSMDVEMRFSTQIATRSMINAQGDGYFEDARTIVIPAAEVTVSSYRELANRLEFYNHTLLVVDGKLQVWLHVTSEEVSAAEQFARALTSEDGVYRVSVYHNDHMAVMRPFPRFLVGNGDANSVVDAIVARTAVTVEPVVEADGQNITIKASQGLNEIDRGLVGAHTRLIAEYDRAVNGPQN